MEEDGGEWLYSDEMGVVFRNTSLNTLDFEYETLTKEELADIRMQKDFQYGAILKVRK